MRAVAAEKVNSVEDPRLSNNRTQPIVGQTMVPEGRSRHPLKRVLNRVGLKVKLIVPYVILTLLTAMIGTFVVTRLVASSVRERFVNQMYEASRVAADAIVRQEQDHLANLRLMVFTEGVAEAIGDADDQELETILWPLALNNDVDAVTAINAMGQEIMTMAKDPVESRYGVYSGADYSSISLVSNVLTNTNDVEGDKYAGLMFTRFGPYMYTSAPVRDAFDNLIGVLMIGTDLSKLLEDLKSQALADIVILDLNGALLASTFPEPVLEQDGDQLELTTLPGVEETKIQDAKLSGRDHQIAYAPLLLRNQVVGVLGVALPSEYVVHTEATSRNTFFIIFALTTVAVIIVGYLLSESIARPIQRLRAVSKAVAEGDLSQQTGLERSDEIGDLASAFDLMTFRLRRRTAQAARLYQESVQRNKELAESNAQLQAAQQQLVQSEKLAAVGQLTAGIVHDVKNPLAVIKGLAEELSMDDDVVPGAAKQLTTIRESANRATRIVSDLLKFARQSTPELRRQDVSETVRTAVRLTDYLARKGQVDIKLELPESSVLATYDASQIEQVLVNLIQNAIQAMPEGGRMRIRVKQGERYVSLMVQDTGIGIPQENLNRIFDPFFTTKPAGEGTGLGLSVSYGIVAGHHGRIDVKSRPGLGTVFTVLLPINQPQNGAGGG